MADLEILTYWNVETLAYVLEGVASIMGGAGYKNALKMVFYVALILGIFAYVGNKTLEIGVWLIQALIFVTLLNLPAGRVLITDRTGLEPPRAVANVPFSLAIVAQTSNITFGWLTRTYEAVFGVPDGLGLQKGDLAFGHRILKNVNRVVIRDPALRADLMQYIKECTLYDVRDGQVTAADLIGGVDTWNVIFNPMNTSPARFVTRNTLSPIPITDSCRTTAPILKARVDGGLDAAKAYYGRAAFPRADADAAAVGLYTAAVGQSYDWVMGTAADASSAMRQSMFNNLWRDAGAELPTLLNDPARVQELQALTGAATAATQANGSNATLSMLAQETLPHVRNWVEAIIFSAFPLLVLLVVLLPPEGAKKAIGGYFMSIVWIGLWPVMFAIINHLSLRHLAYKLKALKLATTGGVPFQLSDVFDATIIEEQAAIGYMVILVPFLAGAIVKMGQGQIMGLADKIVSGTVSAGGSAGAQAAMGNVSAGQVGMDTTSVNTTTMNKYDRGLAMASGGSSLVSSNGDTVISAANGRQAIHQLSNRLLASYGVESRQGSDLSSASHRSNINSGGTMVSGRTTDAATMTSTVGRTDTRGSNQSQVVAVNYGFSGSEAGSTQNGEGIRFAYGNDSSFSASAGASSTLGLGVNAGASMNAGASIGVAGPGAPLAGSGESRRIEKAMRAAGATEQEVQNALANHRNAGAGQGFKAPTQSSRASASLGLGGSVRADNSRTYQAAQGRTHTIGTGADESERAEIAHRYTITGGRTLSNTQGEQSSQVSRQSRDASQTRVDDFSVVSDAGQRHESGIADRSSRNVSDSVSISRDLLANPATLDAIAARSGMSASRLVNLPQDRLLGMVADYAAEKGLTQRAMTRPQETFAGESLHAGHGELNQEGAASRAEVPNRVAGQHAVNTRKTGYRGVAPVNVDVRTPNIAPAIEREVRGNLDPGQESSLPARSAPLKKQANAWASPDKEIGAGNAGPQAVVDANIAADAADTATKAGNALLNAWDRFTGGDGAKNGRQFTPVEKDSKAPTVRIRKHDR